MKKIFQDLKSRIGLFNTILKSNAMLEFAYIGSGFANVFSTLGYTIIQIFFVDVIFSNVNTIASYSKNDMIFLIILSQISFFVFGQVVINNSDIPSQIRTGKINKTLTMPVPSLFFVMFSKISSIKIIRDGIFPMVALVFFAFDFRLLDTNLTQLFQGGIILLLGNIGLMFLCHIFLFITFFKDAVFLSYLPLYVWFEVGNKLPLQFFEDLGFTKVWIFLPFLIPVGYSSSVVLGKIEFLPVFLFTLGFFVSQFFLMNLVWKLGLRSYEASSG